jgi:hypothetical protein
LFVKLSKFAKVFCLFVSEFQVKLVSVGTQSYTRVGQ